MANIACKMADCANRSKRPLRKWRSQDGSRLYGCKLGCVVISRVIDFDGDIEAVAGRENMAHCCYYTPEQPAQEE